MRLNHLPYGLVVALIAFEMFSLDPKPGCEAFFYGGLSTIAVFVAVLWIYTARQHDKKGRF